MDLAPSRLRLGEWLAGGSAALLLADMLLLRWYRGPRGAPGVGDGWHGLIHLRWLMVLTIAAALALAWLQASRRSPALPVSMSVIVTVLAVLNVLWMAYRVLINAPPHQQAPAFIGFACACGIVVGGYLSLRKEGISTGDAPSEIELIELRGPQRAGGS